MVKIIKNAAILTAITLVAGAALGTVYEITKEPIRVANEKAKKEACEKVFPGADSFEPVDVNQDTAKAVIRELGIIASISEVYQAMSGGEVAGYVITTTDKEGYGGDIQLTVGIQNDSTVNGVEILTLNETAGLGMNAKEDYFISQYADVTTDHFYVSKDGGDGEPIEALSGATITSRAVTGAVNAALAYFTEECGGGSNE